MTEEWTKWAEREEKKKKRSHKIRTHSFRFGFYLVVTSGPVSFKARTFAIVRAYLWLQRIGVSWLVRFAAIPFFLLFIFLPIRRTWFVRSIRLETFEWKTVCNEWSHHLFRPYLVIGVAIHFTSDLKLLAIFIDIALSIMHAKHFKAIRHVHSIVQCIKCAWIATDGMWPVA